MLSAGELPPLAVCWPETATVNTSAANSTIRVWFISSPRSSLLAGQKLLCCCNTGQDSHCPEDHRKLFHEDVPPHTGKRRRHLSWLHALFPTRLSSDTSPRSRPRTARLQL